MAKWYSIHNNIAINWGLDMIFESHAHYDDEAFDEDRDELLKSMRENEIEYIVNVGSSLKTSRQTIELIDKYDFTYVIQETESSTGKVIIYKVLYTLK